MRRRNDERQSGATSRCERTCPIKPAGPLQPSRDAAIAMVRQADVAPQYRMLAATSRRRPSVPGGRDPLDDVPQPQPTSMLAATRAEFVFPCDLI